MSRPQRIRLVVAAGLGLLALGVALLGAPLVAALCWPTPDLSSERGMLEASASAVQIAANAGRVSLASLAVAGVCFTYVLVVLAGWFIGSSPQPREGAS